MAEIIPFSQLSAAIWLTAFLLLLMYGGMILVFRSGWDRIPLFSLPAAKPETRLSVIIPVRNEAERLPGLLESLAKQTYPGALVEVIVVDDHSDDSSLSILNAWSSKDPTRRITVSLSPEKKGKKAALEEALSLSSGELIVQADGDIHPGPQWLHAIASFYEKYHPRMIILPVAFDKEPGPCGRFFRLEFASLTAVAGGSAGAGRPVLCNGASLAWPKDIFRKGVDLFGRDIPSGDDMLLLQALKKKHRKNIKFLKSSEALVTTPPPAGLKDFFQQRVRWVSKSRQYNDPDIIAVSLLTLLTAVYPLVLLIFSFININYIFILFIYILIKSIYDYILLIPVLTFLNLRPLIPDVFIFQWIYPIYVFFSAAGGFRGKFIWKKRFFRSSSPS